MSRNVDRSPQVMFGLVRGLVAVFGDRSAAWASQLDTGQRWNAVSAVPTSFVWSVVHGVCRAQRAAL